LAVFAWFIKPSHWSKQKYILQSCTKKVASPTLCKVVGCMNWSFVALFIVRLAIGHWKICVWPSCHQAAFYIFNVLVPVIEGNICGLNWSYPVTSVSEHYIVLYLDSDSNILCLCADFIIQHNPKKCSLLFA